MRYKPETSNIDLIKIAKAENIKLDAIVFKDELKYLKNNPVNIIINMSSSKHQGTHWTSLYINTNVQNTTNTTTATANTTTNTANTTTDSEELESGIAIYFDSFGIEPPVEVINYVRSKKIKYLFYNRLQYQHTDEGYCGEFSIVFLGIIQTFI